MSFQIGVGKLPEPPQEQLTQHTLAVGDDNFLGLPINSEQFWTGSLLAVVTTIIGLVTWFVKRKLSKKDKDNV